MSQPENRHKRLQFNPVGLAARSGTATFCEPLNIREGSFRKDDGSEVKKPIRWSCISIEDYLRGQGIEGLDFLKLDIEGFEYEVLHGVLDNNVAIRQIAVEIS